MATHPSVLAWRIPWTEKPGGLPVPVVAKSQGRSTHGAELIYNVSSVRQTDSVIHTEIYLLCCCFSH